MNEAQRALLRILLTIQTDGPIDDTWGICANVADVVDGYEASFADDVEQELEALFVVLGLDPMYPVDSGEYGVSACLAYDSTEYMWDRSTQYGRNRWALLDRCIRHLANLE